MDQTTKDRINAAAEKARQQLADDYAAVQGMSRGEKHAVVILIAAVAVIVTVFVLLVF